MSRTTDQIDAAREADSPSDTNQFMTLSAVIDLILPVGTIQYRDDDQDPGTLYPGTTWTAFGAGKVLMSSNGTYPRGSTLGSFTHAITENELPAHAHWVDPPSTNSGNESADHNHTFTTSGESANHVHTGLSDSAGSHTHLVAAIPSAIGGGGGTYVYDFEEVNPNIITYAAGNHQHYFTTGVESAVHVHSGTTSGMSVSHHHSVDIGGFWSGQIGSGNSMNLAQPTISVKVWKRTA